VRDSDKADSRRDMLGSRQGRLAITAILGTAALFIAACQSNSAPAGAPAAKAKVGALSAAADATQVTIKPGNGRSNVNPSAGVTVTATGGKVQKVTVTSGGGPLSGYLNATSTVWHSKWALHATRSYKVTATAVSTTGKTVTATSTFRTLTPSATIAASTILGNETYGVGMPITINFSSPVTHKAAVEKAIELHTSKPIVGAWAWDGDQSVSFRPQTYWPQHTRVSFDAHFNGLAFARGVYGTSNLSQSFTIGNSLIAVVGTKSHYMMVYYKNKRLGRWAVSTGQPGDDTANGTYLTIEKGNPVRMKGNGYNVLVPLAVRFTWSGNYIHWADWSVAQQGIVNVSHGCVNISPEHAAIYYPLARAGDPVTVIGSPASGIWDDGYTQWFLTWHKLLKDSATHEAVQAGPTGSTLVDPSSLPAPASTSRLHDSKPYNYLAVKQ
jgi:lipoprotein-anchoring transpeptidase ErfK/SrfK